MTQMYEIFSLQGTEKVESRNVTTPDTLMDLIRQMFPPNLIQVKTRHPDTLKHTRNPDTPDNTPDNLIKWI